MQTRSGIRKSEEKRTKSRKESTDVKERQQLNDSRSSLSAQPLGNLTRRGLKPSNDSISNESLEVSDSDSSYVQPNDSIESTTYSESEINDLTTEDDNSVNNSASSEAAESQHEAKQSNLFQLTLMFLPILVVIPILCIASLYINLYEFTNPEIHVPTKLSIYKKNLVGIKQDFPSQTDRLWTIISIGLEDNLQSQENNHPAVLMLASNEEAFPTTECLAKKLSNAFASDCSEGIVVDGMSLSNKNPEAAKLEMDDMITGSFQSGACSTVISQFEKIPAFATTAFYQFCENDNAPFKNVAVIFTVLVVPGEWGESYKDLTNIPQRMWDKMLGDYLSHSLHTRDPDRMTDEMVWGLLSRITPSVVWVNSETNLNEC